MGRLEAARISDSCETVVSDAMLTVGRTEPLEHAQPGRVRGRHHHGDLPDALERQLARVLHVAQHVEQSGIGDQEAADARLAGACDVLDGVGETAHAAHLPEVGGAVGRARVGADVEPLARPREQRHLDAGLGTDRRHLAQLRLAQQHRARALGDAVDDDALRVRAAHDLLQHARALDARDLHAEGGAVGEAGAARRRGRQGGEIEALDDRVGSHAASPVEISRIAVRSRPSPTSTRGQRAGLGQAAAPAGLDEEGVLRLATAGDARVPGDRVARRDPLGVPAALALARDDLELALAVGDRAALVVLAPRSAMSDLGVGLVARGHDVAVGGARSARREHAALDRQRGLPGRPHRVGQAVAARHPRGRGVQPAALGHDDRHREALHRRARSASGWRKRSTRSSPPTIRQAPNAPTRSSSSGDARLQIEVALARPPRAQRPLERSGGIHARAPRGDRARTASARGAARRGRRRHRRRRRRDHRSRAARAGRPASSQAASTKPSPPANHSTSSSRRPRAGRSCSASMRGRSTFVVSATASVGVTTTHIALAVDPASMRFVSPAVSQATAAADVRTTPGTSSSAISRRTDASLAATSTETELSAVANSECTHAYAPRSIVRCQLGSVRHDRTVSATLADHCDAPGMIATACRASSAPSSCSACSATPAREGSRCPSSAVRSAPPRAARSRSCRRC